MENLSPCNSTLSSVSLSLSSFSTESFISAGNSQNLEKTKEINNENNINSIFWDQNAENNGYEYFKLFEDDPNTNSGRSSCFDSENNFDPDYIKSLSICLKTEIEKYGRRNQLESQNN